jgi:hypothetical protein
MSPRTATITVSGTGVTTQTIQVTQEASAPFLSVTPNSLNFIAAGETKTFTVTCNTDWTVKNDASWLTISSSNDGDGVMNITAAPNTSATERSTLITLSLVSGLMAQTIEVTQDAAGQTSIQATGAPSVIIYSQNGNVVIKSNSSPIEGVVVYDLSGKALKVLKDMKGSNNGNNSVEISGLPKQQALIVKVTTSDGNTTRLIEN